MSILTLMKISRLFLGATLTPISNRGLTESNRAYLILWGMVDVVVIKSGKIDRRTFTSRDVYKLLYANQIRRFSYAN